MSPARGKAFSQTALQVVYDGKKLFSFSAGANARLVRAKSATHSFHIDRASGGDCHYFRALSSSTARPRSGKGAGENDYLHE